MQNNQKHPKSKKQQDFFTVLCYDYTNYRYVQMQEGVSPDE